MNCQSNINREILGAYYKNSYRRMCKTANNLVRRYKKYSIDPEDVVQESFLRVLEYGLDKFCELDEDKAKKYFNRIIGNTFRTMLSADKPIENVGNELDWRIEEGIFEELQDVITKSSVLTGYFIKEIPVHNLPVFTGLPISQCRQIINNFKKQVKDDYGI